MKSAITLLMFLLFVWSQSITAQENVTQKGALSLRSVYLSTGAFIFDGKPASLGEFRNLAPASSILQSDLNGYEGNIFFSGRPAVEVGVAAGFRFRYRDREKDLSGPEFRIGLNAGSASLLYSSFSKMDRVPVDTLYSNRTGEAFPVDSVSYHSVSIDLLRKYLNADFSVIFRSRNFLGLSIFGGIGVQSGISFENELRVRSLSSNRLESLSPFNDHEVLSFHGSAYQYDEEQFSTSNSFSFAIYIPAGVNVRLSSQSSLLRMVNFYYEVRPGYYYYSIPDVRNISEPRTQHILGMRISID